MKAGFDIGNLVYVVLTIVFLVVGALGKKKKPVAQVSDEAEDVETDSNSIKSQFQELFREFNPGLTIQERPTYDFSPGENIEDVAAIDIVPRPNNVSSIDFVPINDQPIDSNINYKDQAQSSLDTAGMDEGLPIFDYQKDHHSLVYNTVTNEYNTLLLDHEVELAEIIDGFDPKTAFVYSEIFKRKEF